MAEKANDICVNDGQAVILVELRLRQGEQLLRWSKANEDNPKLSRPHFWKLRYRHRLFKGAPIGCGQDEPRASFNHPK